MRSVTKPNDEALLTRDGAYKLAEQLRAYWAQRGVFPEVRVEQDGRDPDKWKPLWVVRSNIAQVLSWPLLRVTQISRDAPRNQA